jgi:3',5'-cyclic AMP phosphodiesterase CpdA
VSEPQSADVEQVVLAQLTDPHLHIGPGDLGSAEALAAAVRAIAALDPAPDALLVTGDLVDHATDREYARVAELLAPLPVPVHVLSGNHDDPDGLRAHLGAPGSAGEPLQYARRIGPLRLIACDTTRRGRIDGALGAERLGWLEAELAGEPDTPTVLAMHHPPFLTGADALDAVGLAEADRAALGELVARHSRVTRIVAGHIHRTAVGAVGGCPAFVCPSSYLQISLDLSPASRIALVREPPGFALHVATTEGLTSHVQPIGDFGPPVRI